MADKSTTYLATTLKDQGYTGVTGTTPYKPPTTTQQSTLQDLSTNAAVAGVPRTVAANATVLNINFDGTQNNGQFAAKGETPTNVHELTKLQRDANGRENTIYLSGVGAQTKPSDAKDANGNPAPGSSASSWDSLPSNAAKIANGILESAYDQVSKRIVAIQQDNPDAPISINLSGFSRGGAEAVAFANLINERGLPGFPPGKVPIDTMVLFDPVSQTNGQLNTTWPTNVKSSLVMVAMDEGRAIMPAMPVGEGVRVIGVPGAHCDIGGSFDQKGISAVTLGLAREFQDQSGNRVAPIPENLTPDPSHFNVHNSGLDNYGNVKWAFDENGKRYYEGSGLGSGTVQDALKGQTPHGDEGTGKVIPGAVEYTIPADPSKPTGAELRVREVRDGTGAIHLEVRDADGQLVLQTQPGEQVSRDAATGKLTVTDGDGNESRSYTAPAQADTGPAGTNADTFTAFLTTGPGADLSSTQQDGLAAQLDKLGLGGGNDLSFHTMPDGSVIITNRDGDRVGEIQISESGAVHLNANSVEPDGTTGLHNVVITDSGTDTIGANQDNGWGGEGNHPVTPVEDLPTSTTDGSDAHFNHHPATETTPTFNPDLTENQANTLLADIGFKPETPSQPGTQLADASAVTGAGTVSDAGTGGIGLGNTSTPNASESNQPVALVEPEQPATNTVAPVNTPANPVDTGPDGSDAHFLHHPAPSIAVPLGQGLTLVNTLIGLKNWDKQSDLSHLGTAVNLYNQVTQFAGVNGPLGNLGQFGAGISFITSLQSDNPIAIASSGASFYNSIVGANSINAIPIPVLNFLSIGNALQSGDPFAIASSVAACYPPWGTVASVVISIIGSLIPKDIPEPPNGSVHYTWDETGAITTQTDHDISQGAATANSTAGSVLGLLQSVVTANNDKNDADGQSSNNLAIDPSRMPRIGHTAGTSWMEITHADGTVTKETINPDTIGERLLQIAVENDALAPQWQIQTAQAHAKAEHAATQAAQAQAATDEPAIESASAIDGQASAAPAPVQVNLNNNPSVFGTEGKAVEAADHKTQSFGALVVHLRTPEAQQHLDDIAAASSTSSTPATNSVLADTDGDGFWEQTQWVAGKDDAGNAQGMLVLDRNHNGVIENADILHLGGDSSQLNSLDWLDANGDHVLDASDPAFAAIKLFVDINNNGQVDEGEQSSLSSISLSSINFQTGQVNYSDGQSDALTATTLTADTEGIKLEYIKVVGVDGELEELKVGSVLVHEGYQGQVRVNSRGEIVADDDPATDTHLVSQRINSYEFNAAHLSDWEGKADQDQHRHGGTNVTGAPTETSVTGVRSMGAVLGKENVKTTTTMDVGDARVTSDAPAVPTDSTTNKPNANTTITLNAGDARIRSLTPAENAQRVVFVPSGVRDGWMTADGKELLQLPDDGLFGTGGMAGALMAVALGAVQSTAFAMPDPDDTGFTWQTTPLVLDGAGGNSNNLNFNTDAANGGNASASTIDLGNYATVHRVRLGVRLSAAPLADASAASYTIADAGAASANTVQTPASATNYASSNPSAPDANTAPTPTLIDNQLTPKAKTPATTTTSPADPASNTESTAPTSPTTSTTSPATPTPAPVPPSPTLVAIAPTAPAAVTPTTGSDQLSNPLEDTSLYVSFATLLANDVNASSITAVGNATHGSVTIIGGEVVFTPSQNYHGPASFVYQVVSTDGNFALGQADFDISGVNDVPLVLGETASANEDIALVLSQATLLANDTDVDVASDGQTLSVSAVGNASHGTVSILGNGSVQFIADADYHGAASFTYMVSDGHGGSATATALVQVAGVNDTPVAVGEVITSAEDTTLLVSQAALLANDTDADVTTDGQTLSISAVSNASHGTVTLLGSGQIQFIPTANYSGTASFDYVVDDGNGGTVTATANILVGSEDDAPVASGETVNSLEDQSVVLTAAALLVNETDIDNVVSSLSISRVTGGAGGSAVLNASGNIVFTPNANFSGTASFTYWVKDPDGMESNPATVTLNVAAVNDAPYAQGEVLSGASEDAVFNIDRSALLGNDGDEEDGNSSLSIELVGNASSGAVAMGAGGNLVFTPTANFNGNVSFQYQVRDTSGALGGHCARSLSAKTAYSPRKTCTHRYEVCSNRNIHRHEFRKSLRRSQNILSHVHGVYAACFAC